MKTQIATVAVSAVLGAASGFAVGIFHPGPRGPVGATGAQGASQGTCVMWNTQYIYDNATGTLTNTEQDCKTWQP